MNYEQFVKEQESRRLFEKPVRWTTILRYPGKYSYDEFISFLQSMGLQENLRDGEKFIEDWIELFLAYHEIENHHYDESNYRNIIIDKVIAPGRINEK